MASISSSTKSSAQYSKMAETPQAPRRWYVVRTFSGHENKVKLHLEKESKELKLEDRIFAVMVPSEKIIEMKDKKKKSRTKTFFPGYILVEAILDKVSKHLILNAPSVMGFVGTRGEPV